MMMLHGMRIIVQQPYPRQVKRSWKERLFEFPWKPFQKYRTEYFSIIPEGEVLVDNINLIVYCNPKMYDQIRKIKL